MPIVVACHGCGAQLRVQERFLGKPIKCPKCGQVLQTEAPIPEVEVVEPPPLPPEAEEVEERPRRRKRRRSEFAPCPSCGDTQAERVLWTIWGSFYGPALLKHVRCQNCGTTYNGRSGRSNLIPAIIFVMVPLILIFVVLAIVGWVVYSRLNPPARIIEARPIPVQYAKNNSLGRLAIPLPASGVKFLTAIMSRQGENQCDPNGYL